jgi:DNA repair exonuclease SbcCD ATPase subunit
MTDMQALFHTIEQLSPAELEQVRQFVEERRDQLQQIRLPTDEEVEARINALHEAFAELREGLSEQDLQEISWAMNYEYVDPDALKAYDWIDELPEDER